MMAKRNFDFNLIISPTILIVSIALIATLQKPLLDTRDNLDKEAIVHRHSLQTAQLALSKRLPLLGFDNMFAGWSFLNFIQYYGDVDARNITGYGLVDDYYKLVVEKDPRFVSAYFIFDPATTLFAGRADISVRLMEQGLRYIQPQQKLAYQVWLFKATNELLFLGNTQEAIKSYRQAANWASKQNTERSIAFSRIFSQTANFLVGNPDSRKARASSWLMILNNARDDRVRNIALENLRELGAQISMEGNVLSVSIPDDFKD